MSLKLAIVLLVSTLVLGLSAADGAIIADHNAPAVFFDIPASAIQQAKATLHIAYGHTSHGSQLTSGMYRLIDFMNGLGYPTNLYAWSYGGHPAGALDLRDYAMGGDVGYYPDWVNNTRGYLGTPDANTGRGTTNPEINVIIWAWCGQVSSQTEQSMITVYLAPMTQLELDYPGVKFVYMTGHLDGTGQTGSLNIRNQQIRDYCVANNKILYDFADIESYDPDGLVNYMVLNANANCDYDGGHNWALDWQASHTINVDWYDCSAVHSQALNGNRKAYAAWWLWARLAGWGQCLNSPSGLTAAADSNMARIVLNWTDNSTEPNNEDGFIIQRSVDGGAWSNNYATVSANVTTYTDTGLVPGSYSYRIIAHLNGSCDSSPSNVASAIIVNAVPTCPNLCGAGLVNFRDFSILADEWGAVGGKLYADIDKDGRVNIDDLELFFGYWLHDCVSMCPDLRGAGTVDFSDFSVLADGWDAVGGNPLVDLNGDGSVDIDDLNILCGYWLEDCDQ